MNDFDLRLLESNKIGAKTLDELFRKERSIVSKRVELLKFMPPRGNLGYDHLKAIHFFLFRDVYSWAGKDRADMGIYGFFGKEDSSFCRGELIPKEADKIFTKLKEQDFFKNAKDINELAKNIKLWPQDMQNVTVSKEKKAGWENNKALTDFIKEKEQEINGKGRILVRASGTEPLIRVMVEAESQEIVDKYVKELVNKVKEELL